MNYNDVKAIFESHLELQDTLNKKIDPYWATRGREWGLAITVEAVEAIDHHGWKWWKKQEPNMPQLQIELIDIWHFILSAYLEGGVAYSEAATVLANSSIGSRSQSSLLDTLKTLAATANSGYINIHAFWNALDKAGIDFEKLNKMYLSKNVLNIFRQDNGYKEGTYVKMWHGEEDNVFLERLLDETPNLSADALFAALDHVYAEVLKDVGTTIKHNDTI